MLEEFQQHIVADLVCKEEYIAASDAAKEAVWLKKFIIEFEMVFAIDDLVLLHYDRTRAIAQAKESKSHHRTKHIL